MRNASAVRRALLIAIASQSLPSKVFRIQVHVIKCSFAAYRGRMQSAFV